MLVEKSEQLFDYYLVNRFNHAKLETAVSDIAKEILSIELLEILLVENNKYDKKPLLFALFKQKPDALKNIYLFGFLEPEKQTKTYTMFWFALFRIVINKSNIKQMLI